MQLGARAGNKIQCIGLVCHVSESLQKVNERQTLVARQDPCLWKICPRENQKKNLCTGTQFCV